jgi:alkylation response protein AidB-like acyl-CoA dehydrogenase
MELLLTDEQKLLQESAATLVERTGGTDKARTRRDAGGALDRDAWRTVAEAGWLGILASESAGGLGLGMTELSLVLEQAGRGLLGAPVAAAALSAAAIGEGESDSARDELASAIVAGERLVLPALLESVADASAEGLETNAASAGQGYTLTGTKTFIPDAGEADAFLVAAQGPDGPILGLVDADGAGASVDLHPTVDGGAWGTLTLSGAEIAADRVIAGPNRAPELIARIRDGMLVGLGAELLGVMSEALDIAIEYIKTREQFGRPIGSFQALQHRAVNDYVDVEMTRSLLFQICAAMDEGRGAPEMTAAIKAKASVAKSAIQMHGGIGFTDEHSIGFYLKRAMALSAQYGNEAVQRRRYAELAGIASS